MMNEYEMNNEILKSVMEGMGVQPSDNMLENWNTIMNFVPSSPEKVQYYRGNEIKLSFNAMSGGNPYVINVYENMLVKDALYEFGKKANMSEDDINKCHFLCSGKTLNVKIIGTIKENNLKNDTQIILVKGVE